MALKDLGFRIVDYPMDEARAALCPFDTLKEAQEVLVRAEAERPDVKWAIVGHGPYGVRERGS